MRRIIGVFILVAVGFAVGASLHSGLSAQASQASQGQDVLPALLAEVRGLRAAMEQIASSGPRVQLALGRLQLQEQRVNNLLRRLEAGRASLADAQRKEQEARQELTNMEEIRKGNGPQHLQNLPPGQVEGMVRDASGGYARAAAEAQRLKVEESGIVQELVTEQGRWSDINQQMEELERALTRK